LDLNFNCAKFLGAHNWWRQIKIKNYEQTIPEKLFYSAKFEIVYGSTEKVRKSA
jgi:hypothetical protein